MPFQHAIATTSRRRSCRLRGAAKSLQLLRKIVTKRCCAVHTIGAYGPADARPCDDVRHRRPRPRAGSPSRSTCGAACPRSRSSAAATPPCASRASACRPRSSTPASSSRSGGSPSTSRPRTCARSGPGFDLATACGVLVASEQLPGGRARALGGLRRAVARRRAAPLPRRAERRRGRARRRDRRAHRAARVRARGGARRRARGRGRDAPAARSRRSCAARRRPSCRRRSGAAAPPAPSRTSPTSAATPEAIRALTIAAAGAHNLLLSGPPGTGKTMLARRVTSILPPLTRERGDRRDAHPQRRRRATSATSSCAQRPFRAPHHTISPAGLVGGGSVPQPGEATPGPPRRPLPRRAVGVQPPGARVAAPAARGRHRGDRARPAHGHVPDALSARRLDEPLPLRLRGRPSAAAARRPTSRATDASSAARCWTAWTCSSHMQRPQRRGARARRAARRRATSARRSLEARERQAHRLAGTGLTTNAELTPRLVRELVRADAAAHRDAAAARTRRARSARAATGASCASRGRSPTSTAARASAQHHVREALGLRQRAGPRRERVRRMTACDACLRRTALVARLAPHVERARRERRKLRELLALSDDELIAALAGDRRGAIERAHDALRRRGGARARSRRRAMRRRLPPRRALSAAPARGRRRAGGPARRRRRRAARSARRPRRARGRDRRRAARRRRRPAGRPRARPRAGGGRRHGRSAAWRSASTRPRTPGALEVGGPTITVLAGGADVAYPASKRGLHRELVAHAGGDLRDAAGLQAVSLVLSGAQPHDRRPGVADDRRRGDRALGLAHHRRPRAGARAAPSARCPAR